MNGRATANALNASLLREDELMRTSPESWRPLPCTEITLLRRFFDLQAGTIWSDLRVLLPNVRGTLVDVGCGAQPYRRLLDRSVDYIGIDTADAGAAFGYQADGTRYYDGRIWPVDYQIADVVLATETLEHVLDPAQFLSEADRVLKPGGTLILTVPFAARWHFIPYDFWRFTPSGLRELLAARPFEDVRIYARGNEVTVACYKAMALLVRFIFPQNEPLLKYLALRGIGLLVFPIFIALTVAAQMSLRSGGGDDCLGYTVLAVKSGDDQKSPA